MSHTLQSIKQWPEHERPRERLLSQGPSGLSDAELVAILLRSGTPGKDAVSFARELLQACGGLRGLVKENLLQPESFKGLGPAKKASLAAATEIARRQLREEITGKNVVSDPEAVMNYLLCSLRDRKREVFKILLLDKGNRVLKEADLFEGTLDQTFVYPREIVREALAAHAAAVILVHNHPSGRTEPSAEDRHMTEKIKAACETVGVKVLDHVIVGHNRFFSFKAEGLLE